eukprot:COSAG01_NODE_43025_length_433_cov_185.643713_1_plen_20_part_10
MTCTLGVLLPYYLGISSYHY